MPRDTRPADVLLLPLTVCRRLLEWTSWGYLDIRRDTDGVTTIAKYSDRQHQRWTYTSAWQDRHRSRHLDVHEGAGVWYRSSSELVGLHRWMLDRHVAIPTDSLREHIPTGWRTPPGDRHMLVLTVSPTDGEPMWSAWAVSQDEAVPTRIMVVDDGREPLEYLAGHWPIHELAQAHITVVGVGSIGSTTAETLAAYGTGRLSLVDPDRLEPHNVARHHLTDQDVGRLKVTAMREAVTQHHRHIDITAYPLDVVVHADVLRPVFADSDVIVCAADGITARRVVNHLARRARVPVVFSAVLEDGAFGELLRVRNRTGCLLCHRRQLTEQGALDPEPRLELGYGTGNPHRPMTAAPGDLALMGSLAAKAAMATLLEARGRWNQRLPGDWAIIGLQPSPEMPAPFDIAHAGDVRWDWLPASHDDCPTCTPP